MKIYRIAWHDPILTRLKLLEIAIATVAALLIGVALSVNFGRDALAESVPAWGPKWPTTGELVLPKNFHTWVFLGSPLTPNALNNGNAAFPEYHNVYVQPEAYQAYRKTGQFPDGTILLKEHQLTVPGSNKDGSSVESSGRGYFPGNVNGIDISVKDSKRFKDTNGWGYFNLGKTRVTKAKDGFDFLGVHLRLCRVRKPRAKIKHSCRIWPSDCSMQRVRQKVRDVIGRRYSKELEEMIKELNPKLRGWANYHIRARGERKRMKKLNGFVHERLRIFLKRKYSDEMRGARRLHGNLLVRLGLFQFA